MADYLVPLLLTATALWGLWKKENVYELLLTGGAQGLKLLGTLLPALVMLLTAVNMLQASGAVEKLSRLLSPLLQGLGIPPETALLLLIRPFSGSAALAVGAQLMADYGVDSPVGRTAAVMLGSTETTFYAISVYCGATGVRKTRYTVPAALLADLTGFCTAAWAVRLFF